MAATPDNRQGIQPAEQPRIETIGQAAQKIREMYTVFENKAPKLTRKYIKDRLDGEEGKTWGSFIGGPSVPFLDRAIKIGGGIEIDAGYNWAMERRADYKLRRTTMLIQTGEGEFEETDAITLHRPGVGFDPGEKYAIPDNEKILQADLLHRDAIPTVGREGKLAWSGPHSWIGNKYHEMTEVTPELTGLISKIHVIYEAVK